MTVQNQQFNQQRPVPTLTEKSIPSKFEIEDQRVVSHSQISQSNINSGSQVRLVSPPPAHQFHHQQSQLHSHPSNQNIQSIHGSNVVHRVISPPVSPAAINRPQPPPTRFVSFQADNRNGPTIIDANAQVVNHIQNQNREIVQNTQHNQNTQKVTQSVPPL